MTSSSCAQLLSDYLPYEATSMVCSSRRVELPWALCLGLQILRQFVLNFTLRVLNQHHSNESGSTFYFCLFDFDREGYSAIDTYPSSKSIRAVDNQIRIHCKARPIHLARILNIKSPISGNNLRSLQPHLGLHQPSAKQSPQQ